MSTHVQNLASYTANSDLTGVTGGQLEYGLDGDFSDVITGGTSRLEFADGLVTAVVTSSQTMPGKYMDDIGQMLTIGDNAYYWRMKRCGGDSLLVGERGWNIDDPRWQQVERGDTTLFDEDIADTFSKTPFGHGSSDWYLMWYYVTRSIFGAECRHQKLPIAGHLEPDMQLEASTFGKDGYENTLFCHGQVWSGKNSGARISIDRNNETLTSAS